MMLISAHIHMFVAEAAPAATDSPCWQKLGNERRSGYNPALARRCAR